LYVIPIREYVEDFEDVEPLVLLEPPLDEVIVGLLGRKETEILIIFEEESEKYLLSLDQRFSTIYFFLPISRRRSKSGD
jgi:hypothetical protein